MKNKTIKKFWYKFIKRKKEKTWKTDCYFGIVGDEQRRGHASISGAVIINGKLVGGVIYYLRDISGNVLINKNEKGESLIIQFLQTLLFT